jgi:hypothetical protein
MRMNELSRVFLLLPPVKLYALHKEVDLFSAKNAIPIQQVNELVQYVLNIVTNTVLISSEIETK